MSMHHSIEPRIYHNVGTLCMGWHGRPNHAIHFQTHKPLTYKDFYVTGYTRTPGPLLLTVNRLIKWLYTTVAFVGFGCSRTRKSLFCSAHASIVTGRGLDSTSTGVCAEELTRSRFRMRNVKAPLDERSRTRTLT